MKIKTIALSLGLILAAGALYAADPFDGTWKLNESKSKLTRGTSKNTKVVYNSRLIRDKVTVTGDGVDAEGKPVHSEWKGRFNGKDYEVTGDPAIVALKRFKDLMRKHAGKLSFAADSE